MARIYLSLDVAMSNEIDYTNNPLHGVSLSTLLTEIVDHYGFEILFAYGASGVVGKPGVDKSSPADPWANSRK